MGGGKRSLPARCSLTASRGDIQAASTISSPSTLTAASAGSAAMKNQVAKRRFCPAGVSQCENVVSESRSSETSASSHSSRSPPLAARSNSLLPASSSSILPPGNIQTSAMFFALALRLSKRISNPSSPSLTSRIVAAKTAPSRSSTGRSMLVSIVTIEALKVNVLRIL